MCDMAASSSSFRMLTLRSLILLIDIDTIRSKLDFISLAKPY